MRNKVRELRKDKGITQIQLAKITGCAQSDISKIESGRRGLSDDLMLVFASALGVHPSELIDDPKWNRVPVTNINEPLLRSICGAVVRAAKKNKDLDETAAATVIVSLYKRYVSEFTSRLPQSRQVDADTALLVAHELMKRA